MYKHRIVQGLADLIEAYGGKGRDPIMNAVWWGIKGQVPMILEALDSNEEAVKEIERKLMEVLDIKPQLVAIKDIPVEGKLELTIAKGTPIDQELKVGGIKEVVKRAPPKRVIKSSPKPKPTAEIKIEIKPVPEE